MSASDLALIVISAVALVATAALTVTVIQLRKLLEQLRSALESFAADTLPLATQAAAAADRACAQVDRLEDVLGVAASMTATMDSATAATVRVLLQPCYQDGCRGAGHEASSSS
jgi:hypothetical protein